MTGKITAHPNPLPANDSPLTLQWDCSEGSARLCVEEEGAPEKLIAASKCGTLEIGWIQAGREYLFRLSTSDEPRRSLAEVPVRRLIAGSLSFMIDPNPLAGKAILEWDITAPAIGEITVSEEGGLERVVCRGASGSFQVAGLRIGAASTFRLYSASGPREPLAEAIALLPEIPWTQLLERVQSSREGKEYGSGLAEFLGAVLPVCVHRPEFPEWFRAWEEKGVHLTPVHFYEPIPDSRTLPDRLWGRAQELPGVDLNEEGQSRLLREEFPKYRAEFAEIPVGHAEQENQFYLQNGRFDALDAVLGYCMVRHLRPGRIIEVGSGYSTLLLARAALKNDATVLESIEPYPEAFLTRGVPGLSALREEKVEDVPLSYFTDLSAGDFLFIDTSHVVRIGGDVNHLFLKVLPSLQPGVVVHVHDIFLPFEYSRDWVIRQRRFWTEQYLLQAFLTYNSEFEVMVSSAHLQATHLAELKQLFSTAAPWGGGSFWMRRRPQSS
ncbi:MAG: class I SAM-dependent methyltransferase [Verrucomicrobiota bacterium]|nr:class I SAM-dependent methyltransferase [Verrucomicrobiota bacterium]